MRTQNQEAAEILVPVLVVILVPVPCIDAAADGDGGSLLASEIVNEQAILLGGVPVKARPLSGAMVAALN